VFVRVATALFSAWTLWPRKRVSAKRCTAFFQACRVQDSGLAGLPDGLFSNQKSQFGQILEGLGMENVVIFYDHLEYFMAIWHNICWQFGIGNAHLVYFFHFGMFGQRKIWQPCSESGASFLHFRLFL
jgi:hypothetical protein